MHMKCFVKSIRVGYLAFVIALFSGGGCGKGLMGGAGLDLNILNPVVSGLLAVQNLENNLGHWSNPAQFFLSRDRVIRPYVTTATNGENTTSQLSSLKYYIKQIRICEELTTSGTAYNNPKGCFELYNNDNGGYDSYLIDQAKADTDPNHYLDLMDPATKTKLQRAITAEPGTYHWGLIDWYQPLKIKAEVTVASETLVTKNATASADNNGNMRNIAESALNTGSASEAVLLMNNGGTWFRFQNPFVIEQGASENYVLDLVFNPDKLIKAGNTGASNATLQDTSFRGIYVPLLDMTPVVHKASEKALKESYTLTGLSKTDIRLDLYYIQGDASKTIYGVDFKSLYIAATNENVTHPQKISSITSNSDGTLNFMDYQPSAILSGFTRMESGAAGTKTATFTCQTAFSTTSTTICGGATATVTYSAPTVSEVK